MTNLYEWNGKTYRGMPAVAKAAGVNVHTVKRHLSDFGNLDGLGRIVGGNFKPIRFAGRDWPTRKALSEAAGISDPTLRAWLVERPDEIKARLARRSA
ncbi:hypothetical protein ACHFJ0_04925 [Paracoccus sp. NGMCC 1.201697]|uniref:Uncharacterized protein n=1 Tax=Paracoccus broussonetiae subsp. drimophilus TaxID=3373869 RepID=A0ABW7LGW0_9RHOB